ncbi:putative reverse transcriptase domain-containing protein, partial [Tanacetum coccineum]
TRNKYAGSHPRYAKFNAHHLASVPCLFCYNCQKPGHYARDCRSPVKQVAPVNAARMRNNQSVCYECGNPNHFRNTCPKLNRASGQVGNHLTIEGADFSFISTKFVPLLNVTPSIIRPGYVIKVANGKKVETDKIIHGFKLELGDSLFNIDLIPFGHGSFDVIVGMDWLSRHKAEIVCHEKVVRIPCANGKILMV